MKVVFADTLYWVAIIKPRDSWQDAAHKAKGSLGNAILITTDEILTEFLNTFAGCGAHLREQAGKMVSAIMDNPNVRVIPQTRGSFLKGLSLYEQRADKEYSLTDCVSMHTMTSESVTEVLTNDHHFEQEGFTVLIKKNL